MDFCHDQLDSLKQEEKNIRAVGKIKLSSLLMDLEEIALEASQLDEESRASLASRLLQSLSPPDHSVTDQEVFQRMKEAEEDPSVMIGHDEFVAGIRRRGN
ncbi:MAG: hypothetical protein CMO55_19600 [Verrucomicrobiales bacterium]|nr:hypothetical protein [Verrucomicrobiales bacterium]